MKKLLPLIIIIVALFLSGCNKFFLAPQSKSQGVTSPGKFKFQNPKKSAHFESNTPAHGSILAGVPINVVINFNFDLSKLSNISISKDGKEYGAGDTTIDVNKLTMRRNVDPNAADGLYAVNYKACWPDGSCHEGNFQFVIERKLAENFVDARNKSEINISLENISFNPQNLRISKGTKVIWTNKDNVVHYVNTDSHPAHTYYLSQNSKALNQGDTFTISFDTPGIYPYHCSAHADTMSANILVE